MHHKPDHYTALSLVRTKRTNAFFHDCPHCGTDKPDGEPTPPDAPVVAPLA